MFRNTLQNTVGFYLQGIYCLSPQKQSLPVQKTLQAVGPTYYVEYTEEWDPRKEAAKAYQVLLKEVPRGKDVIIFATSIGAYVAPYLHRLIKDGGIYATNVVFNFDPPFGRDSLYAFRNVNERWRLLAAKALKKFGKFDLALNRHTNLSLDFVLNLLAQPPKDENVVIPADVPVWEEGLYIEWVKKEAKENLLGNSFAQYCFQIEHMLTADPRVDLYSPGTVILYFSCESPKNVVTVQPLAASQGGFHFLHPYRTTVTIGI